MLNADRIIPRGGNKMTGLLQLLMECVCLYLVDWLLPLYEKLWMKMLQVDQRVDPGCVNM